MSNENTSPLSSGAPLGEISQAPPAFDVFLDKHQMKLIALAAVLAIFAVCYVVYDGLKKSAEESAGSELVSAEGMMEYQSIVKNHSDTAAAFSAKILLAEEQWTDGQQDDAIQTLEKFIESEGSHPARPSAQASLASKLESQGKIDQAEKIFRDLTEDPASAYLAPYAWISLGDLEMEKGDAKAAVAAYEQVERNFPGSSYLQEATSRQLLAKAGSPEEISAPISVPDVNFTDGEEGLESADPSEPGVEGGDLIEALEGGFGSGSENTPFSEESVPEE